MEVFDPYGITILVAGLTGLLLLIQLFVADVAAIKSKHTPGYPIESDHESFLFRATRAHANTNESVAALILFVIFGIFSSASPLYLNIFSVVYLVGRIAHMCCYYANLKLLRSIAFGLGLIGLIGMFVVGLISWF